MALPRRDLVRVHLLPTPSRSSKHKEWRLRRVLDRFDHADGSQSLPFGLVGAFILDASALFLVLDYRTPQWYP